MPPRGRVTRGPTTVSHDHPGHWELIMERDKNQYAQKPNSPPGFEPKGATTSPDEIDGEDRPSSDNIVTTGLDAATSLPLFERNERSQPTTVTHDDAGHWELMHERGQASANARSEQRREVAEFSRQQGGTTGMPQAAKNADATLVRKTGTASSVAAAEVLTAFSDLGRAEPVPYVDADSSSSELQPGREQELRGQNKSRMNYLSPPSVKSTPSKDKQVERREQQRAADAEKPRAAETEGKAERNETTTKPVEEKQTESADVLSPEQQAAIQQYLRDNNTVVTQLKDQIVVSGKKNAADGAFEDGFTTFDEDQIKQAGGVLVGGDSSSRRRRSSGVGIFTEARADRSSSSAAAAFVWESRRRPLNLVRLTLSKQNETGKVNILPAGAAFHTHTEWLLETLNRSKEVQVGHDEDFPFFWKQANSSADPLERPLTSLAQLGAVETEKINMKEKKYFPYTGGAALHQALTAMSHELRTVHYEASEKAETSEARLAALRVELEREREKSAFLVKKVAEQHGDLVKMAGFLEENRTKTQTLEGTVAEEQDATRGGQTRRPKSVEDQMLGDICDDILSAEIGKNHDEALMAGARFLERNQTDLYRMGLFPDPLLGRTAGRRDANQHTGASKKHVANAPGTRSTDRLSSFTATSNLLVKERERADAKSRVFSGRDQPASTSIDDQRPTAVPPVGASRALHAEEESASDESSDVSASEQERQTEITFPGRLSAAAASGTKRAPKPYDGDHDVIIKSDYDRPPLVPASTQRHQLHYPTPGRFPNSINGRERPSKAVRTAAARVVQLAFRVYLFRQFRAAIREQNEQTSESEDAVDQLRLFRDEKLARNELQILRNAAVELFHEPYLSENYFNWLVEDLDDVGRLSLGVGAGGEVLDAESHRRKVSALQQLHLTGAHGSTEQRFKSPLIPDALKICTQIIPKKKKVAPAEAAVGLGASGAAPRVSPEKILDEIMGVEDTPMISSSGLTRHEIDRLQLQPEFAEAFRVEYQALKDTQAVEIVRRADASTSSCAKANILQSFCLRTLKRDGRARARFMVNGGPAFQLNADLRRNSA
eukprot:g16495.t1